MKFLSLLALLAVVSTPCLAAEPVKTAETSKPAVASATQDGKNLAVQLAAVMPLDQQVNEFTTRIAEGLPQEKRDLFQGIMKKNINIVELRSAAADALAKTYTVPEMKLLLDFYSKPETKVIMAKMTDFATALAPSVEVMVKKGVEEAKKAGVFPGVTQ